jgi:hypothetical protein
VRIGETFNRVRGRRGVMRHVKRGRVKQLCGGVFAGARSLGGGYGRWGVVPAYVEYCEVVWHVSICSRGGMTECCRQGSVVYVSPGRMEIVTSRNDCSGFFSMSPFSAEYSPRGLGGYVAGGGVYAGKLIQISVASSKRHGSELGGGLLFLVLGVGGQQRSYVCTFVHTYIHTYITIYIQMRVHKYLLLLREVYATGPVARWGKWSRECNGVVALGVAVVGTRERCGAGCDCVWFYICRQPVMYMYDLVKRRGGYAVCSVSVVVVAVAARPRRWG